MVDVAERLGLGCAPAPIRAMLERACGGQMGARRPGGHRASTLTRSGVPFEVSVSGGRGQVAPAVRYITESATDVLEPSARVAAQVAAVRDLVAWLPTGDEAVADLLQSFVATLYPDPATTPGRRQLATWIGAVHHAEEQHHAARLKVYGGVRTAPGAMQRLIDKWPVFAGLASVPDHEKLISRVIAAIEVDASGSVNHKIYLKGTHGDIAIPMKLVRHFGDQASEMLSELVRCGVDAADLHRYNFFVCCASRADAPTFGLTMGSREGQDLTGLARALASRHHGTTHAVDALAGAAESSGATWSYSAIGLGFSADHGIDKLTVYGTPTWTPAG